MELWAPRTEEALLDLLKKYLQGEVFFSAQVRDPSLLPMIFLPLAVGGLSFPEVAPRAPVEPEAPDPPLLPPAPLQPPEPHARCTQALRLLQVKNREYEAAEYEFRWGRLPASEVRRARIAVLRAERDYRRSCRKLRIQRRDELREWVEGRKSILRDHDEKVRVWKEEEWVKYEKDLAEYGPQVESYRVREQEWVDNLKENFGVLYAEMSTAMPRSVNGYPIFSSMGVLNRTDWQRLLAAIRREEERKLTL